MPICTTCSRPVDSLFVRYGKDHVVLARCSAEPVSGEAGRRSESTGADGAKSRYGCGAFADPYLEHGIAIVLLDLMLVKPRAYRHLLFNRPTLTLPTESQILTSTGTPLRPPVQSQAQRYLILFRRLVALLLIDAYIRWFYLCIHRSDAPDGRITSLHSTAAAKLCAARPSRWLSGSDAEGGEVNVLDGYLTTLFVTSVEMGAFHLVVATLYWASVALERSWVRRRSLDRHEVKKGQVDGKETHDNGAAATAPAKPGPKRNGDSIAGPAPTPSAEPRQRSTALDVYTPDLAATSMLLSQLSTMMLLGLVLLWDSKFPRPPGTPPAAADAGVRHKARSDVVAPAGLVWLDALASRLFAHLPSWSVDGTVRAVVGGLSAGVALGVIVPNRPAVSTAVLLAAWSAQAATARAVVRWLVG